MTRIGSHGDAKIILYTGITQRLHTEATRDNRWQNILWSVPHAACPAEFGLSLSMVMKVKMDNYTPFACGDFSLFSSFKEELKLQQKL